MCVAIGRRDARRVAHHQIENYAFLFRSERTIGRSGDRRKRTHFRRTRRSRTHSPARFPSLAHSARHLALQCFMWDSSNVTLFSIAKITHFTWHFAYLLLHPTKAGTKQAQTGRTKTEANSSFILDFCDERSNSSAVQVNSSDRTIYLRFGGNHPTGYIWLRDRSFGYPERKQIHLWIVWSLRRKRWL